MTAAGFGQLPVLWHRQNGIFPVDVGIEGTFDVEVVPALQFFATGIHGFHGASSSVVLDRAR